jgi:hypothetical protein
MGRSASGSPYSAPKAPNAPQGTNDYSYLSGIYGASYGRKKAAADFARPTLLARPVSPVENLITTLAEPPVTTPEPEVTTPEPEVPVTEPTVDTTLTDLQTDDEEFEDYLESDDYVQTTAGTGSTTMEDAAADPFDTSVTTMDDVPTMEEGIADTSGGMLDEDPEDVVMTGDEVPTMDEAIADTTDDYVMPISEVPTMDELRQEQLEIERLQGLTEQNALEEGYENYLQSYIGSMRDRKASGQEFFTQLENATRLRNERQFDSLFYGSN